MITGMPARTKNAVSSSCVGGSLAPVSVTSEPGASRAGKSGRAVSADISAGVEYRLVRNRLVQDVERGRTMKIDVCDAHPELLRAARNVGRPTKENCPICAECRLVKVTFVFGAKLPAGGRCPGTAAELAQLCRRPEPVLCYEVEVCPECAWHHLMRKYPAGGPKGRKRREVAR
jgi:hypothetical protein